MPSLDKQAKMSIQSSGFLSVTNRPTKPISTSSEFASTAAIKASRAKFRLTALSIEIGFSTRLSLGPIVPKFFNVV